jgi:flagellar basal-body rod protein FlgB
MRDPKCRGARSLNPVYLFELSSQQSRWLSARQTAVAENVANAYTPGFSAKDIAPFQDILDQTQLTLSGTNPSHLGVDPYDVSTAQMTNGKSWETTHSGNSVSLEQEMIKAGEVNRSYSLNVNIVKAFNRMLASSIRG